MGNYRKKPVEIEAFKLGVDYIPDWFMDAVTANEVVLHGTSSAFDHIPDANADIHTIEGWHHANYGDYIIRGVKGELYPCNPDIFDMTYEAVNEKQKNADRVRAMRDEELAQLLVDGCRGSKCEEQPQNEFGSANCFDCRMKWLKEPAGVKNDECAKNPGYER